MVSDNGSVSETSGGDASDSSPMCFQSTSSSCKPPCKEYRKKIETDKEYQCCNTKKNKKCGKCNVKVVFDKEKNKCALECLPEVNDFVSEISFKEDGKFIWDNDRKEPKCQPTQ
jgi:hypothetical protein